MLRQILKLNRITSLSLRAISREYNSTNKPIGNMILRKSVYSSHIQLIYRRFSTEPLPELDFGEFIPLFNRNMIDFYIRERFAVIFNVLKDGTQFKLTKEDVGDLNASYLRHFCQIMVDANDANPSIPTHRLILPILRYFVDYPYVPGQWMLYNLALALNRYASTDEEREELMAIIKEFDAIHFMQGRHILAKVYYEGRHVKQNFVAALALLEINVRTAYMPSLILLAIMLRDGNGVTQDYSRAAEIFLSAGLKEDPDGFILLAELYQKGLGVEKSDIRALQYMKDAAKLKSKVGIHNVGCAYFIGRGCEQSYIKAFNQFRKAAELGNPLSQINLGNMYYNGLGVAKNLKEARKWYVQASSMKREALDLVKIVDEKIVESMEKTNKE
ncbi:hypothetical protein LOD99_14774 [Oopsacas minuta]|uniref:Uncharacterized protein n=1 Tax=Oopsacas minuta TaxID=111878 RepID=A0AAV7KCZ1_9METZ|nr:hypothetical protein LOD99_14774 [Oopsacas minuta]